MGKQAKEFRVMTSGLFTAAYLSMVPTIEALTNREVVTVTTSIGTGKHSIASRLQRREPVDLMIVAQANMAHFLAAGYIIADSAQMIARSSVAIAVREGAPAPDARCAKALKDTFLKARTIAYSASESGKYLTTQLYQRLGIAEQCLPKSHFVGGGERTGAVVARGDADLAFQQVSELKPVPGIAHITPIPAELQTHVLVAAGVPAWCQDEALSRSIVQMLASVEADAAIIQSGLQPVPRAARIPFNDATTVTSGATLYEILKTQETQHVSTKR